MKGRLTDVLYKLTTICYKNKAYARYPRFKVSQQVFGYYHTLEDAEKKIGELVAKNAETVAAGGYDCEYYGFEIAEIPFNVDIWWQDASQRTRTYLEDGSFFAETKVSTIESSDFVKGCEPFKGRSEEECRFRVGDLVEVLAGETVSLEIVCSLPPTPERAEQIYHNVKRNFEQRGIDTTNDEICWILDDTDDCYTTLDGDEGYIPNHSHVYTICLFPVRRKVSDKLREMLKRGLEKAQNE
jgi:hypothetical protein